MQADAPGSDCGDLLSRLVRGLTLSVAADPMAPDVLKWPFCVGAARRLVLEVLEKHTGASFEGNLWKFVDAAAASGVGRLEAPAIRPTAADARNELRSIVGAGGR